MRLAKAFLPILATIVCGVSAWVDGPAYAQAAPAARGKVLFLRCSSCHAVARGAPAKIGPSLAGIIGRTGGTQPGYRYSAAMQKIAPVWTEATLDRWLASPNKVVPGTSMAFAGMPNRADRSALIAYLKSAR